MPNATSPRARQAQQPRAERLVRQRAQCTVEAARFLRVGGDRGGHDESAGKRDHETTGVVPTAPSATTAFGAYAATCGRCSAARRTSCAALHDEVTADDDHHEHRRRPPASAHRCGASARRSCRPAACPAWNRPSRSARYRRAAQQRVDDRREPRTSRAPCRRIRRGGLEDRLAAAARGRNRRTRRDAATSSTLPPGVDATSASAPCWFAGRLLPPTAMSIARPAHEEVDDRARGEPEPGASRASPGCEPPACSGSLLAVDIPSRLPRFVGVVAADEPTRASPATAAVRRTATVRFCPHQEINSPPPAGGPSFSTLFS